LSDGIPVDTDILALLPKIESNPTNELARRAVSQYVVGNVIFLVGEEDPASARNAATIFHEQVKSSSVFMKVDFVIDESLQRRWLEPYLAHRYSLLSDRHREWLNRGQSDLIVREAYQQVNSPFAAISSELLEQDPLFLFSGYLKTLQSASNGMILDNGLLVSRHNNRSYVLLRAIVSESVFNIDVQETFQRTYTNALKEVRAQYPQADVLSTGMILHATEGTQSARTEVTTIGIGSIMGIIILLLSTFRSLAPLWLCLLSILTGLIAALSVSLMVFDRLHIITLVFGASLIGVSIDYSFHYLCEHFSGDEDRNSLDHVIKGITLGLITSVIAYLSLSVAPFPGLRQIALFSSVGLVASYFSVIFWYPMLLTPKKYLTVPIMALLARKLIHAWDMVTSRSQLGLALVLFAVGSVYGITHLEIDDNVRNLQNTSSKLVRDDELIQAIMNEGGSSQFYLVEAATPQLVLEREKLLSEYLRKEATRGAISSYRAISNLLPPIREQRQNRSLLQKELNDRESPLRTYLIDLGFQEEKIGEYVKNVTNSKDSFLQLDDWLQTAIAEPYRFQWLGAIDGGFASVVVLGKITDIKALEEGGGLIEGVSFVDPIASISKLMQTYRELAIKLVVVGYFIIFFLLIMRYRFSRACLIMAPPVLGSIFAVSSLAAMGESLNIFNTLALLLVLGVGIDYTIFFAERTENRDVTMLAIMLAALTTLLSFGLLALSDTLFVHSFGLTVCFGLSFVLVTSPAVGSSLLGSQVGTDGQSY
jgi:predicted exporter